MITVEQRMELVAIRDLTQALRQVHYTLRHPHIDGCVECILLACLKEHGF